jgi:hypothetical protein
MLLIYTVIIEKHSGLHYFSSGLFIILNGRGLKMVLLFIDKNKTLCDRVLAVNNFTDTVLFYFVIYM